MQKLRIGVVGLGHRGRHILKLSTDGFDFIVPAAACDIRPANWFEKQWLQEKAMCEQLPDTKFYENYDQMLDEAGLDVVIVETGADIHADFVGKRFNAISTCSDIRLSQLGGRLLWKAAQKSQNNFRRANPNEGNSHPLWICTRGYRENRTDEANIFIEHVAVKASPSNENGDWRKLLSPIRYCTHSLGPLLAILDEDLTRVSSFGTGQHGDFYEPGVTKDDMVCAQFQTPSGVVVRLMRNGRCRAKIGHHNYRVFGTEVTVSESINVGVTARSFVIIPLNTIRPAIWLSSRVTTCPLNMLIIPKPPVMVVWIMLCWIIFFRQC